MKFLQWEVSTVIHHTALLIHQFSTLYLAQSFSAMQRWCNVKPFYVYIYFRTYCWRPCYDLVETVVGRSPLLWTATSLSYVNFLLLLMSMFLSLLQLHTQICTQMHKLMHTHTHTHTRTLTHARTHARTHTRTFLMTGFLFRAFPQIF